MEDFQINIGLPQVKTRVISAVDGCSEALLRRIHPKERPFFVVDGGVPDPPELPRDRTIKLPGGEGLKTLESLSGLLRELSLSGFRPGQRLVAIGGGALMDLVGLAAGLMFRGVPLTNCPTTAVGMVDACLGGKTGIDLPWGKNLVGMFKFADTVLVDTAFLETLDKRDLYSGLFEVFKTALLAGGRLWGLFHRMAKNLASCDPDAWSQVVPMCLHYKSGVVSQDPLDKGARRVLNLGHTLGHAIETVTDFSIYRHGEAVLIGLVAALKLSVDMGLMQENIAADILEILGPLPVPGFKELDRVAVLTALKTDKKGGQWVLLRAPGSPVVVQKIDHDLVLKAMDFAASTLSMGYDVGPRRPVVLVLHGPNLQRLGQREIGLYGRVSYVELVDRLRIYITGKGMNPLFFQSDKEGELVAAINRLAHHVNAVLVNPGAFTHTSVALRDALAGLDVPVAEVHITAISNREGFRRDSLIRPIADLYVEGQGIGGYFQAINRIVKLMIP